MKIQQMDNSYKKIVLHSKLLVRMVGRVKIPCPESVNYYATLLYIQRRPRIVYIRLQ